jgi:hypothetical protein
MKRIGLLVVVALLLAACTQQYLVNDDLDYPYNLPPVGSTVVVRRVITVPAGETRIFLQNGERFSKQDFDRYEPSCSFELRKLADKPREIQPGSFVITKVQRLMRQVVRMDRPPSGLLKVDIDIGGKPMVIHGYHLWLGSETQSGVMRMTCWGYFDDLHRAEPPSLNDVKKSLGEFADLRLAT